LVDSVDRHPGEVSSNNLRPEGVSGQDRRIKVEKFDPFGFVTQSENVKQNI
jgi:hypothetical protein